MKKLLLLSLLFVSSAAMAEPPAGSDHAMPTPPHQEGMPPQGSGMMDPAKKAERFAEHKAKVVERMTKRLAEGQKRLACVQAAADHEAMRACFPEKKGRHGMMQKEGGMKGHKEHGMMHKEGGMKGHKEHGDAPPADDAGEDEGGE